MGGGKSGGGSAPAADPRIGEAAVMQAQTGADWLSFARDAFQVNSGRQAKLDALTQKVTAQQLGIGKQQQQIAGWQFQQAKEDRARWEKKGIPAQDAFAKEAGEWGSEQNLQKVAAEAGSGAQAETAAARDQARRETTAMGVSPDSGRFAGVARAGELGTAATVAGAMNTAREQRRNQALSLKADVANMYAGLPAQSAAATQLGLGAGTSAANIGSNVVQLGQGNQQLAQNNAGVMNQGFAGAMSGYQGMGSTLTNLYNSNLEKWRIQQEAKSNDISSIFGALGTAAGGAFAWSDPKLKKNVKQVKKGAGIKALKKIPVNKFDYKPGVADGGKHVGAMSDKFAKATGLPDTGKIHFQDALGITMKAVQDLSDKVDKLSPKKSGAKAKGKPKARRSSQSPANARVAKVEMKTAKPAVKAQAFGIRRS